MNAEQRTFNQSRDRKGALFTSQRLTRSLTVAALLSALTAACGCTSKPPVPASHSAFGAGSERADFATLPNREEVVTTSGSGTRVVHATTSPWEFAGANGRIIRTPHFRIHTTATRDDFLNRLPLFYESLLVHYTSALGELPMPAEPVVTYLFQSRSQWQAKTNEMLPDQAEIFSSLGRGGFTTGGTAVLYYIDHRRSRDSSDTFAIAAHEGWHQFTQSTFKHSLPIWLEEGIATYMEGFTLGPDGSPQFRPWTNSERRAALFEAVRRDDLIPLAELVRRSPQQFLESGKGRLLTYYAQVWALTRFLVEWEEGHYRSSLEHALQDAAHGRLAGRMGSSTAITSQRRRGIAATSRSGPWLILEYFNRDFAQFEEQYVSYVRTLTQRGR